MLEPVFRAAQGCGSSLSPSSLQTHSDPGSQQRQRSPGAQLRPGHQLLRQKENALL